VARQGSRDAHLVETEAGNLRDILDAAAEDGIDLVVVDARPSLETDAAHVAAMADVVMVPTRPAIREGHRTALFDRAERLSAAAWGRGGVHRRLACRWRLSRSSTAVSSR
jgi:hypothetical protein